MSGILFVRIVLSVLALAALWTGNQYSADIKERAEYLFTLGEKPLDVSDRLLVPKSTIYRWKELLDTTGTVFTLPERQKQMGVYQKPNVNKILHGALARQDLYARLSESSVRTLKEHQESLLQNTAVYASLPTICRFWDEEKQTRKKCSIFAKESDPFQVLWFWQKQFNIVDHPEQLLFGDESHRNDHDSTRGYGRSLKGTPAYQVTNLTRGGYKLSLLSFTNQHGPCCYDVFQGAVSGDDFLDFAWKRLIDVVQPYPAKESSVIVIDNCSIHHSQEWRDFVEDTGILCLYLPAYCPFLNVQEWVFNAIKMCEKTAQVKGEREAVLSLVRSTEQQRVYNRWLPVYQRLGYA